MKIYLCRDDGEIVFTSDLSDFTDNSGAIHSYEFAQELQNEAEKSATWNGERWEDKV